MTSRRTALRIAFVAASIAAVAVLHAQHPAVTIAVDAAAIIPIIYALLVFPKRDLAAPA